MSHRPYTGEALSFPDFVSTETFISETRRLAKTYGDRFALTEKQEALVRSL